METQQRQQKLRGEVTWSRGHVVPCCGKTGWEKLFQPTSAFNSGEWRIGQRTEFHCRAGCVFENFRANQDKTHARWSCVFDLGPPPGAITGQRTILHLTTQHQVPRFRGSVTAFLHRSLVATRVTSPCHKRRGISPWKICTESSFLVVACI